MKKKSKDKVILIDSDIACMDTATLRKLFDDFRNANRMLRLQKKKLLEEKNALKKWGEDLSLLNELNKAVVATLDADRIVHTAHTNLKEIVHHDILSVILFKQKKLWLLSGIKLDNEETAKIKSFILSSLKEIADITDEETYKMAVKFLKREKAGDSYKKIDHDSIKRQSPNRVLFPMEIGDNRIGAIQLIRYSGDQFTEHEYNIVSMVGSTLTLALRNSEIHREVQELATIDSLTGLYNKRYFLDILNKEFKSTQRYQTPVSLIMIDLDNFKLINDKFGHQAGDMVLKNIASLLTKSLREIDIPTRYGGDEAALILPETVIEQAFFVAKRIKRLIEEHPIRIGEDSIKVTASFGISSCPNSMIKTAEEMITAADKALYEAKKFGRNRIASCEDIFMQNNAYLGPLVF
ncbi:MAG: hypothetical protein A2Y48_09220 [Nitrospirae bacterium RIFCSPLOW2_12_42_9]|nr:MAG: hypothetical protein A2Z60_05075 [Nitrospirae bacterium RIFCSPLOWO2_02_42_7]OGW61102.1 MAG: hypothetical protein A2Y48_09220 [Nitrospirae bacterium RIFCSPLOW2_12_42_9]HBI24321.1 hypothetical protein [Nitrospiraceae bacterium]